MIYFDLRSDVVYMICHTKNYPCRYEVFHGHRRLAGCATSLCPL